MIDGSIDAEHKDFNWLFWVYFLTEQSKHHGWKKNHWLVAWKDSKKNYKSFPILLRDASSENEFPGLVSRHKIRKKSFLKSATYDVTQDPRLFLIFMENKSASFFVGTYDAAPHITCDASIIQLLIIRHNVPIVWMTYYLNIKKTNIEQLKLFSGLFDEISTIYKSWFCDCRDRVAVSKFIYIAFLINFRWNNFQLQSTSFISSGCFIKFSRNRNLTLI